MLHHGPVWRRGPHFFLVISVNHYVTVNIFSYTHYMVLLFISMPFSGDRHWSPYRVMSSGPWIFIVLKSCIESFIIITACDRSIFCLLSFLCCAEMERLVNGKSSPPNLLPSYFFPHPSFPGYRLSPSSGTALFTGRQD